jgi:hypothetical protein
MEITPVQGVLLSEGLGVPVINALVPNVDEPKVHLWHGITPQGSKMATATDGAKCSAMLVRVVGPGHPVRCGLRDRDTPSDVE